MEVVCGPTVVRIPVVAGLELDDHALAGHAKHELSSFIEGFAQVIEVASALSQLPVQRLVEFVEQVPGHDHVAEPPAPPATIQLGLSEVLIERQIVAEGPLVLLWPVPLGTQFRNFLIGRPEQEHAFGSSLERGELLRLLRPPMLRDVGAVALEDLESSPHSEAVEQASPNNAHAPESFVTAVKRRVE